MRILIIKTSSMGDVIHTLPALTDAAAAIPSIKFDWVVEENFAEIPRWHPRVDRVIPVALRRWRKKLFSSQTWTEWKEFQATLKHEKYDFIIDAQGLLKSAWLLFIADGIRCGLDWQSVREPLASLCYQKKITAGRIKREHAVTRMRKLFSQALDYPLLQSTANYGIDRNNFCPDPTGKLAEPPYLVFLHGTTWATKHWPEEYWIELAQLACQQGLNIKLPWGNEIEYERAKRIAAMSDQIEVLPRMKLKNIASVLAGAKAIVAVDTGLGHLAAALDVPTLSLYGPTNPALTGALGRSQIHMSVNFSCSPCLSDKCTYRANASTPPQPPCFVTLNSAKVWQALSSLL